MDARHNFSISIPLNVTDLNDLESSGLRREEIRWEDVELTERDYDMLFDLFGEFNKTFDIAIDEYEEEVIPASEMPKAIELTVEYLKFGSKDRKDAAMRLLGVLNRAHEISAPVLLSF